MEMGIDYGLRQGLNCKRKFRWVFDVPSVSGRSQEQGGVSVLPPVRSARPNLRFKEMEVRHLNEDVFYPAKPDWQPINLVLYDLRKFDHPVWGWITKYYEPKGQFGYPIDLLKLGGETVTLTLYDGCGNDVESWVFEEAWPQGINFQELDMMSADIVLCELTLRYFRAYIVEGL